MKGFGTAHRRRLAAAAATLLVAATAFAFAAASPAQTGARPTISGQPIVGETLTSSSSGDSGVFHWQACDPAIASCADNQNANDPNWSTISGNTQSFTLTSAQLGLFIRVLAKGTSLGDKFVPSAPVGPVTARPLLGGAPALPQHGISVFADPDETVLVNPPGPGGWFPFTDPSLLPIGTKFDTRNGVVRIIAATGSFGAQLPDEFMDYYDGKFKIKQKPAFNSDLIAKLIQKLSCKGANSSKASVASSGPAAFTARRRRKRRRLWGSGSGSYSTSGGGGTGSVRGTTYLVKDKCSGSNFFVLDGIGIDVNPKEKKKKNVFLGPGESYFAERP